MQAIDCVKKNYALPISNPVINNTLDLTAKQDVVQIDVEKTSPLTASKPVQQVARTNLESSHRILLQDLCTCSAGESAIAYGENLSAYD